MPQKDKKAIKKIRDRIYTITSALKKLPLDNPKYAVLWNERISLRTKLLDLGVLKK